MNSLMIRFKNNPICFILIVTSILFYLLGVIFSQFNMMMGFNPILFFISHHYWTLISANFIHFDLLHITFNVMSCGNIGYFLEKQFSFKEFLFITIASGLFAYIGPGCLYYINGYGAYSISGGLSGIIFGYIGVLAVLALFYKSIYQSIFRSIIPSLFMMLLLSYIIPNISLYGHLFGFIGGFLSAYSVLTLRN